MLRGKGLLHGKGLWSYRQDKLDRAIQIAPRMGATHVIYKVGQGSEYYSGMDQAAQQITEAGLTPFAWMWLLLDDPQAEAQVAVRAFQDGFQGFVFDTEADPCRGRFEQATQLGQYLRVAGLDLDRLYNSSFPDIAQHQDLPYDQMNEFCKGGLMPMSYGTYFPPGSAVPPDQQAERVIDEWTYGQYEHWSARLDDRPPLYPVLASYRDEHGETRMDPDEFQVWLDRLAAHRPTFFSVFSAGAIDDDLLPLIRAFPLGEATVSTPAGVRVEVMSPEAGYLNVRPTPSTETPPIAQVDDGTMLEVLEPEADAQAKVGQRGQWLHVRAPDGIEGYAAAWYLRPHEEAEIGEETPHVAVQTTESEAPTMPPWIFGMHDPGDWRTIFQEAGKTGWVMFNQVVDPVAEEIGNQEFAAWAQDGHGVLARLVNAPYDAKGEGGGSIPLPEDYGDFARRCAGLVRRSPGCSVWFIGNEMNMEWHWPSRSRGIPLSQRSEPITPEQYADCFALVYDAIKNVQPGAWVIPSGLNPRQEDALEWFQAMLERIARLDGLDIHAYFPLADGGASNRAHMVNLRRILTTRFDENELRTLCFDLDIDYDDLPGEGKADKARELVSYLERRGRIPELLELGPRLRPDVTWSDATNYTFDQFLNAVPSEWRQVPVFLTEVSPPEIWPDQSDGWMQRTFAEVDRWNRDPNHQPIYAVLPYRWQGKWPDGRPDPWNLAEKPSYRDDLGAALQHDYRWRVEAPPEPKAAERASWREQLEEATEELKTAVGMSSSTDAETAPPPAEPRFWFVTANPAQYDWKRAFAAGSVRWTEARGAEAQKNIRQARAGDVVLAYRSTPDQYITGVGHIVGEPYAHDDRYAVQIDMDRKFDTGITLDELRQAAPDLQHVTRARPASFSPVTHSQWAVIRELILHHNPDLRPDDLPPALVPSGGFPDTYSPCEAGLRQLLSQIDPDHPSRIEAATLGERLRENIARSRQFGDTETNRSDRSQTVHALNRLALSVLGVSYNELCDFAELTTGKEQYVTAIRQLLDQMGRDHPSYLTALALQQRLRENIARSRQFGDTDTNNAERSQIIAGLDSLTASVLGVPFGELHGSEVKDSPEPSEEPLESPQRTEPVEEAPTVTEKPDYRAEISTVTPPPDRMLPGEQHSVALEIRNLGTASWPASVNAAGLRVRHRVVRPGTTPETLEHRMEPLPTPVAPGESLTVTFTFAAPMTSGTYQVVWDMVREPDGIVALPEDLPDIQPLRFTLDVPDLSVALSEFPGLPVDRRREYATSIGRMAQEDHDPEIRQMRQPLVAALITTLFDPALTVRRNALYVLYELRESYDGLDDLMGEAFAAREADLPLVRELTVPGRARAQARQWLEPFLPAPHPPPPPPDEELGATEIRADPTPDADRTITVIRQTVWHNVVMQAMTREQDTHTLDIHLTPRVTSLEAETMGRKVPGQERQYQVVLTLMEQTDGRLQARYFEGPLLLDVGNEPLGPRYGAALHNALFNTDPLDDRDRLLRGEPGRQSLLTGYRQALGRAEDDEGLRLQLRINTQSPELHDYKWEYLWDLESVGSGPVSCSARTPFSRVLHVSSAGDRRPTISPAKPLRILAAMASPADLAPAGEDPENEDLRGLAPLDRAEITALSKGLAHVGALVEPLQGDNLLLSPDHCVSLEALRQRMLKARDEDERPIHVLHLLCHGRIRSEDRKSYLVLHAAGSERAELVPEERFADVICQFVPDLRLVVLASCLTALPTREQPLQGVARRLMAAGVPAVIAMQDLFHFDAAQCFSQRLYAQLGHHGVIDRAVNAARRELYDRRKEHKNDRRPGRVAPKQWGVPVLFMRLPNGRLFDMAEDAPAQSDPDAETQALPYEEVPGSDPRRLAEGMLRTVAGQMGVQLNLATPALAQTLREAFEAARVTPPPPPAEERPRLFDQDDQEGMRWALVQAVDEHRRHLARRTVLCLRSLARAEIARLVEQGRLADLDATAFRARVWDGGHATWGRRITRDVAGGGPKGDYLLSGSGQSIEVKSVDWHAGCRGFRSQDGERADVLATHTGNLTWTDRGRTPPPAGQHPAAADLERLLYGRSDTFADFRELTQDKGRRASGLDERIASLLLHAVYPDRHVPYHDELSSHILGLLRLRGDSRYDAGFEGYCNLATDLLADEDLGFENLADVGYFLQRLAEGKVTLKETHDFPTDLRVKLQTVNLNHSEVDTRLVIRPGVLEQAAAALNAGQHVILIGPPGTGKTTLAEDLCRHAHDLDCNRGHTLVTATADWTTFDTIGGYMPESGDCLVFRPGIFLETIEARKWLVIDEINRADIDKAFGELFTVLSGQAVTLPYKDDDRPVRILPPGQTTSKETRDYAIHPSWRIIGTMNVYDKASLFAMSYAFMRRFAFVDVAVPTAMPYRKLIQHFLQSTGLPDDESQVPGVLYGLFDRGDPKNHLMRWRALGPAIAQDVVRYLRHRTAGGRDSLTLGHLAEALLLYVVPQFDGLERDAILDIHGQLKRIFAEEALASERQALLERIEELFPFIPRHEWKRTASRP